MSDEQAVLDFFRLILQGKFEKLRGLSQALCFTTNTSESSGLLQLDDDAGKGKAAKEVLESNPEPFITADLSTLVNIDVTGSHILKSAKHLNL